MAFIIPDYSSIYCASKYCVRYSYVLVAIVPVLIFLFWFTRKTFVKFNNRLELENYLKEKKIDEETTKNLVSIYESHIKNNDELKKKITEETDAGKELVELWEKSSLKHLSLTSVGIAIGASYFEQTTGEKIDISIWIN